MGGILVFVAKFNRCYRTIKDHDEYGKLEDDVVMDVLNLYNQKLGKSFVFKQWYVLLKSYPSSATIFMAKWTARGYDVPTMNVLQVDQCNILTPNSVVHVAEEAPPTHTTTTLR